MGDLDWTDVFPTNTWKIYIVDDDNLVCEALASALASVGYRSATYTDPESFLAELEPTAPGCVLLDVLMPMRDGLQVQQALADRGCTLPIIFVSAHQDVAVAVAAMKHGAFDFIEKPVRQQALVDTVNRAVKHDVQTRIDQLRRAKLQSRFATLTAREREVLALLVEGGANKSIAAELGLSSRTVEIHRANIMDKMAVKSVAELVRAHVEAQRT